MKKFLMILMALMLVIVTSERTSATVLDFEFGVVSESNLNAMDPTYGGLTWDSHFYIFTEESYAAFYGNTTTFVSGNEAAFNGFGVLTVDVAGGPIDLNGAWFTGWALNDQIVGFTATSATIEGFLGGFSVGTASTALDPTQFVFLSTNFGSLIDSFTITSSNSSNWWLMDDLTFNEAQVPEPSSLLLLGSGLAGLGLWRRMRKDRV